MNVQMRLARVARVADHANEVADKNVQADSGLEAARLQVSEQYVCVVAAQKDMVAGHICTVCLGNLHVGQAVNAGENFAAAGRQYARSVDQIGARFGPAVYRGTAARPH
jgi:hypothetical protein